MARPKKIANNKMKSLGLDLASEHMPDEWHELFDLHGALEAYPDLIRIIERRMAEIFCDHLARAESKLPLKLTPSELKRKRQANQKRGEAWSYLDPVFAIWLGDRKVRSTKSRRAVVTIPYSEAQFILESALAITHGTLGKASSQRSTSWERTVAAHLDHDDDANRIASEAVSKILVNGDYNPTAPKGQKLTYIKKSVRMACTDVLRDKIRQGSTEEDQQQAAD